MKVYIPARSQVYVGKEVVIIFILVGGNAGGLGFKFLQKLIFQSCIFRAELLPFGHYIHKIFKAFSVAVMSDRPVVLGAGIEAFPEERLSECNGDKAASGSQAATYLREKPGDKQKE